jgi:hypothetical protein
MLYDWHATPRLSRPKSTVLLSCNCRGLLTTQCSTQVLEHALAVAITQSKAKQ